MVLWDPASYPSVVPVVSVGLRDAASTELLRLETLPARVFVVSDRAGVDHVLIANGRRHVQLAVRGTSALRPARLLTDLCVPSGSERARLAAIADFNALRGFEGSGSGALLQGAPSGRLQIVLEALDCFLAGASQREIGEALFGIARTRREWRDPGGHLRDRVRRAVGRGRWLMMKGYLSMLA